MSSLPSIVGPYRIVRLIGEGGMGAVYEARQESLDRRIALKLLHAEYARTTREAVARFFTEAKVLGKLAHPSIVQVFDFGHTPDGTAYLAMEYLGGESLAHRLRRLAERGEALPLSTALQFAGQVAAVLSTAHAQGIVHRDLKPENLMLVPDPVAVGGERVKILDFGIAKLTNDQERSHVKTDTQTIMGSPMYMSPEQCAGAGGVDAKADVYSLGCVMYEMLSGRPPFVAEGAGQIIGMHLFQTPAPVTDLAPNAPPNVAELIHTLLTKDKLRRPSMADAAAVIGQVRSALSAESETIRARQLSKFDADATRAIPAVRATLSRQKAHGRERAAPAPRLPSLVVTLVFGLLVGTMLGIIILSWH